MHHASDQPRASIYYDYQVHDAWLPSAHGHQPRQPVVIAGGGPVGMTCALELARHGVRAVVLESERQVSEGSRAICFTRRSMEILQQVGVDQAITEMGLPWRFGNSYYRGQRVFRMENPHNENDRFAPIINLQQQYLEAFLAQACASHPLIDLRWGNRVTGVVQHDDHAVLTVDTPEGPYTLEADWLVAADGARSFLRSALGLKLEGSSYEGHFVIADIRVDLPLPTERLAFFDPEWNPQNTVLMHREPHNIWRIDYQLPRSETPEQALAPESLRERINAQLAMIGHGDQPWELDWCSVYSARTLTLPDYRCDRTLFIGDAAHLLPIFGVRGANTGFQDAQALAWRLGLVASAQAPESLLDTYSQERVAAAWEIIDEASKSTRFMAPPSPGFRLLRDAVLSLSLHEDFVRPLYHWRTSRPHEYRDSALNAIDDDNAQFDAGPGPGAPPHNVRLGDDDFLLDHLGGGFDLLLFGECANLTVDVWTTIQSWRRRGLKLRITVIQGPSVSPLAAQPHQISTTEGDAARTPWDQLLQDPQGNAPTRWCLPDGHAAYLLRPDQHVCARWRQLSASRLDAALTRASTGAST